MPAARPDRTTLPPRYKAYKTGPEENQTRPHFLLPKPRSGSQLQTLGDELCWSAAVAGAAAEPYPAPPPQDRSSTSWLDCVLNNRIAKMQSTRFVLFELHYGRTKNVPIGTFFTSPDFSAGGHLWRLLCYPRGARTEFRGEYVSFYLALVSKSENVRASFQACLLNRDGTSSSAEARNLLHVFKPQAPRGWTNFVKGSHLELTYSMNGVARFLCGVIILDDMPMPQPDIGSHFGNLLDCALGSDVSFFVGGETFSAHRAVLAARSPVFCAELFGSMADATMPSITVQDMEPAVFKLMLRFIYTDSFPADTELGDSPIDLLQHLLVAADRYALDRLKLICSLKLAKNVSVNTVGSLLVFAETYNCPMLKNKCLDFFSVEKNFKEAVFTDGFTTLLQKFPSLVAELRSRVVVTSMQS